MCLRKRGGAGSRNRGWGGSTAPTTNGAISAEHESRRAHVARGPRTRSRRSPAADSRPGIVTIAVAVPWNPASSGSPAGSLSPVQRRHGGAGRSTPGGFSGREVPRRGDPAGADGSSGVAEGRHGPEAKRYRTHTAGDAGPRNRLPQDLCVPRVQHAELGRGVGYLRGLLKNGPVIR